MVIFILCMHSNPTLEYMACDIVVLKATKQHHDVVYNLANIKQPTICVCVNLPSFDGREEKDFDKLNAMSYALASIHAYMQMYACMHTNLNTKTNIYFACLLFFFIVLTFIHSFEQSL